MGGPKGVNTKASEEVYPSWGLFVFVLDNLKNPWIYVEAAKAIRKLLVVVTMAS